MAIDSELVFKRVVARWRRIALEMGQDPPLVPRRDSQTERMALAAVDEVQLAVDFAERVLKDDIVAWLSAKVGRNGDVPRPARKTVMALIEALHDGSWEDE